MFEYTRLKKKIDKLQEENHHLLKELNNKCMNINFLKSRYKDLEKRLESKSCSYRTVVEEYCYPSRLDYCINNNDVYNIAYEYFTKYQKTKEKLKEYEDVYQKLSETEEQRKNMSQAYEDEYQTRLALQEEKEILKNELDKVNICYDKDCADYQKQINKLKIKNYDIKKENKKLKDQIKRNLNPYGCMYND